ncbi:DUF4148 domain-containing protein [Burkholderia sp. MR1-5-21]
MKPLIIATALAAVFAAPVDSFAQSSPPASHQQLHAELAALEKAGYNPNDMFHYPENLHEAEARLAGQAGKQGYGGVTGATAESGRHD